MGRWPASGAAPGPSIPYPETQDQSRLERFLDGLDGEVVAIVPNVAVRIFWIHQVDFLYIVERLDG